MPSLVIARFTFRQIVRTKFFWVATILAMVFTLLIGTAVPQLVRRIADSEDAATRTTTYTEDNNEYVSFKVYWDGRATYERKADEEDEEPIDFFEGTYWRRSSGDQSIILGPKGRVLYKDSAPGREYYFTEYKMGENPWTLSDDGGTLTFKKGTEDTEDFIRVTRVDGSGEELYEHTFML